MAEPSLRYVIVNVYRETHNSRTEYILGRNSRSEYRLSQTFREGDPNQPGAARVEYGPLRALIQNRQLHSQFHLDLDAHVYTTLHLPEDRIPTSFTTRAPIHRPSGRTLHVHTETIDTGDRREMFGYTARHVIIRTSHRVTPEDDTASGDVESDGWYIDPPAAWLGLHPPTSGHVIFQAGTDTPVFTDIGPREKGFPLLVRTTERSTLRDAEGNIRTHMSEDRDEVTEFSEEALDPDLFVPPRDFRRVARLPGEPILPFVLRMRIGWENFKHKFMAG
jgi:hypothetical protein